MQHNGIVNTPNISTHVVGWYSTDYKETGPSSCANMYSTYSFTNGGPFGSELLILVYDVILSTITCTLYLSIDDNNLIIRYYLKNNSL